MAAFIDPERNPSVSSVTNVNPSALKVRVNSREHLRRERAGQFVLGDLNPRNFAMMPHAALAEAQAAQGFFSLFDC